VFSQVRSWLTGRRLVSLPFSDHCAPLVTHTGELDELLAAAVERCRTERVDYVELRPPTALAVVNRFTQTRTFMWHVLDLRPDLSALFRNAHESSFRRKVRRASREGVVCLEGRSDAMLKRFYALHTSTRRRHGAPPQPFSWFTNLRDAFGERLTVIVGERRGEALAAILLLQQGKTVVYKYGASDSLHHPVGAMSALLWYAVERARAWGATRLDLGRTDLDDTGLIRFKDRLGASSSQVTYLRFPTERRPRAESLTRGIVKRIVMAMPNGAAQLVGRLVYRHLG
jgi:Acetyltransferase (GNAT) domain